ncbi:hypothetical protein QC762_404170 [Podospora pseudocomata]|uniref:F-box domain-containing protein n=1 Tax=Podospora pseudocomata TaxID=2093779 RepID=A0ABR0GHV8_9PEZI|nr:hypothetical protein QC762_404170 [Podospora pseudocomata]
MPLPPILRLSPDTRRRVYLYLGLAPWKPAERYIFNLHRGNVLMDESDDSTNPVQFHGLLLSCRVIYQETAVLLYSANSFVAYLEDDCDRLLALTTTAISALTHLKIVVNQNSCHQQCTQCINSRVEDSSLYCYHQPTPEPCDEHASQAADQPPNGRLLTSSDTTTESLFENWRSAIEHLSASLVPGRLTLSVVCDVAHDDLKAGKLVVGPMALLPRLDDCHIRLSWRANAKLQQLARDAIEQARCIALPKSTAPSSSSPLLGLPRELRLRILAYTDLVTPIREVSWDGETYKADGSSNYHSWHRAGFDNETLARCRSDHHYGCQFKSCWSRGSADRYIGCFCSVRHAAVSSTCRCWSPPTPLFLVCRSLCHEAQHVFFSSNRFIVHDHVYTDTNSGTRMQSTWGLSAYPHARLTASRFLRDKVPDNSLGSIRFLELTFPAYSHEAWPDPDGPAIKEWIETIKHVNDKLNKPGLTLRIIMADAAHSAQETQRTMTDENGEVVKRAYTSLIDPLRCLGQDCTGEPLHRFYAHLPDPLAWTEASEALLAEDPCKYFHGINLKEQKLREEAERLVLGDERYEKQWGCAGVDVGQTGEGEGKDDYHDDGRSDKDNDYAINEASGTLLAKTLEEWEEDERELKEPKGSYWLFFHHLLRSGAL